MNTSAWAHIQNTQLILKIVQGSAQETQHYEVNNIHLKMLTKLIPVPLANLQYSDRNMFSCNILQTPS